MAIFEQVSTLSSKGQTTVPMAVRKVLRLEVGDRIAFRIAGQKVELVAADDAADDPVIGQFLGFLARDMARRPKGIQALSRTFAARLDVLACARANKAAIDLDAPIDGAVAL
jgi:antitoxin PrlF